MKHIYLYLTFLFVVVSITGCKNDDDLSSAKTLKGDAFGYLTFYSQGGNKISLPQGLEMKATNKTDDTAVPVAVDEKGKFSFQSLPMGEYEVVPILSGYKETKVSYYHLGGKVPGYVGNINVLEISRNKVELVSFRYVSNYNVDDLIIKGKVIADDKYDARYYKIRLVFGNDENLSSKSYSYTFEAYVSQSDFEITVPYYFGLQKYKYALAYSDNLAGGCEYFYYSANSKCTLSTIGPASNLLSLD